MSGLRRRIGSKPRSHGVRAIQRKMMREIMLEEDRAWVRAVKTNFPGIKLKPSAERLLIETTPVVYPTAAQIFDRKKSPRRKEA